MLAGEAASASYSLATLSKPRSGRSTLCVIGTTGALFDAGLQQGAGDGWGDGAQQADSGVKRVCPRLFSSGEVLD